MKREIIYVSYMTHIRNIYNLFFTGGVNILLVISVSTLKYRPPPSINYSRYVRNGAITSIWSRANGREQSASPRIDSAEAKRL